MQLTRQPDLALLHVDVAEKAAFARFAKGGNSGCLVEYFLACDGGAAHVHEAWTCGQDSEHSEPPEPAPVGHGWEVCATPGSSLTVLRSLVDLTWDSDTPVAQLVRGCVRLSPPGQLPELGAVRGDVGAQRTALQARKKVVGGCPTWTTSEDRVARGDDYVSSGGSLVGAIVGQYMRAVVEKTAAVRQRRDIDWPVPRQIALLPLILAAGGPQVAWSFIGKATCGEPAPSPLPSAAPVAVYHYEDVARLVADPQQSRNYVLGGPAHEVCFDPTLTIFLSSGSAEHSQARRLWDQVGMDQMHLQELPEVADPEDTLMSRARSAVGIKVPPMPEIAEMVAVPFAMMLWGQRPGRKIAQTIASYATYGAGCIQSSVVAKLPVLPNKIKAIQAGVLAWARNTPVGREMAEQLEKPEFAELRSLYASTGRPVADVAVQNLVDASLFAGLVGTSGMTEQCVHIQMKDPEYVRLFRRNATAFLYETMRIAPVVAGSQGVLREHWRLQMGGQYVEIPSGSTVFALTGITGHDAKVFPEPERFDPTRSNIGEMLTWNGPLKAAIARDYAAAPRFCPGMALSVKIAAQICGHLTRHLEE